MTQAANTYGQALYDLAKEESLGKTILEELSVLKSVFADAPAYSKLLSTPDIPKQERCAILDEAFRGKVHPYVLNFLKILTEKGYLTYHKEKGQGKTHHFTPLVTRAEYTRRTMQDVKKNFFGGSLKSMFSYFIQEEELSDEEINEILDLIKK